MKRTENNMLQILGAAVPAAPGVTKAMTKPDKHGKAMDKAKIMEAVTHEALPGLLAGALGSYLWKKHRVLGFLGGAAIGANAYNIAKDKHRLTAAAYVGAAGLGIAGALKYKKHPAIGYVAGGALGSLAAWQLAKKDKDNA